ncbi:MAG: NAD(P)H-quinone oxidoreductase subunit F, partial [Cyanobacteria bacterium SW_6_48_11]
IGLLPLGSFWALQRGIDHFWFSHPWLVGVVLLVNGLTALNLTRVFRLVFWGEPQQKTRRAPEAPWPPALPMVSLTVATLLIPVLMQHLSLLPDWIYLNWRGMVLLVISSCVGCGIGATIYLHKAWSRPLQRYWRMLQDLLGYDFYVERLYQLTVVLGVNLLSRLGAWLDRYLVDGVVNLFGFASIFTGESLKYSTSGRTQSYVLTILVGISLLCVLMTWSVW